MHDIVVGSPQELGMEFFVTSDTPPPPTVHGGATLQQGEQLLAIWNQFHDDYGVFCITAANFNSIVLLLTMPQQTGLLEIYIQHLEPSMATNSSSDSEDME